MLFLFHYPIFMSVKKPFRSIQCWNEVPAPTSHVSVSNCKDFCSCCTKSEKEHLLPLYPSERINAQHNWNCMKTPIFSLPVALSIYIFKCYFLHTIYECVNVLFSIQSTIFSRKSGLRKSCIKTSDISWSIEKILLSSDDSIKWIKWHACQITRLA